MLFDNFCETLYHIIIIADLSNLILIYQYEILLKGLL